MPETRALTRESQDAGGDLKTERLEKGLLVTEVAETLGVSGFNVVNQKWAHIEPRITFHPRIFALARFDPLPRPQGSRRANQDGEAKNRSSPRGDRKTPNA